MPILHRIALLIVAGAVLFGLLSPQVKPPADRVAAPVPTGPAPAATGKPVSKPGSKPQARPAPQPASAEAAQIKADELGEVPVIMYHRILPRALTSLDRTTKEFRAELERLARAGYVPVTAAEFVAGRIDVPAGAHPVVLTFDDGFPSQFAFDAQGEPEPESAVGILLDVARKYPAFRPVASFYIIKDPFQLADRAREGIQWLVRHGFEVANHTHTHPNLAAMSETRVRQEVAREETDVVELTGAHSVTFAYPYGSPPKKRKWASDGDGWKFQGIFLAGWKPSDSPFLRSFDTFAITRVRSEGKIKEDGCNQFCSIAWLDWLDNNPDKRFTSDGDPGVVTFPRAKAASLAPAFADRARIY
ncbi:MAG: polysaccharide deacetylase family protein [Streptosporangiaceae bacterium]